MERLLPSTVAQEHTYLSRESRIVPHWQLPFLGLHEFPADLTAFEIQYSQVVQRAQIIAWIHRFNRHTLAGLADTPRSGCPRRHDESARGTVIALTRIKPRSLGLPCALWTLARLQ